MSSRRSDAAKREHDASRFTRRMIHELVIGQGSEWWRPVREAPANIQASSRLILSDGSIDQLLLRCPHDAPTMGAIMVWPSIDGVRRCPPCWRDELRLADTDTTVHCVGCDRPVVLTAATHYLEAGGRFILILSVCSTCIEHPPLDAA